MRRAPPRWRPWGRAEPMRRITCPPTPWPTYPGTRRHRRETTMALNRRWASGAATWMPPTNGCTMPCHFNTSALLTCGGTCRRVLPTTYERNVLWHQRPRGKNIRAQPSWRRGPLRVACCMSALQCRVVALAVAAVLFVAAVVSASRGCGVSSRCCCGAGGRWCRGVGSNGL